MRLTDGTNTITDPKQLLHHGKPPEFCGIWLILTEILQFEVKSGIKNTSVNFNSSIEVPGVKTNINLKLLQNK